MILSVLVKHKAHIFNEVISEIRFRHPMQFFCAFVQTVKILIKQKIREFKLLITIASCTELSKIICKPICSQSCL